VAERYPPIEPYQAGHLEVGDGHEIYWETVGNPDGRPALWLHGGPGSGASAGTRRYFDPSAYRAVLFDQRGAGRSLPRADHAGADLSSNTTAHLLRDIELLRVHLGIDTWLVGGVSWGVTLGLAYAQAHPDRVTALVLAAVTSGRRPETDWITRDMRRIFPEEWDAFAAGVPGVERDGDLSAAYARLLASPDPEVSDRAARQWCRWEDVHVSLVPGWQSNSRFEDRAFRQTFARLVTHYWSQGSFLDESPIAAGMPLIADIPGVLIHGRHDVSGPSDTAWDLHRAWPASRLRILEDAGHGGLSMLEAIVEAFDDFRRA
jgi:proline iminopeptidase